MDFIEHLKVKLIENKFEEISFGISSEYKMGATSTEKISNVAAYLNEILVKNDDLINLIGKDVDSFNADLKKQGIEVVKKW